MEVAIVVGSILSAFGNGMNVFRRLVGRKGKSGREATLSEEEKWLKSSLSERPMHISNEYNYGLAKLGSRFESGDSIAHTSLAHTLLVLNTGLINLINQSLSNEKHTKAISRRSLLNLSELAAADTLQALRELGLRLSSSSSQLSIQSITGPQGHTPNKTGSNKRPNRRKAVQNPPANQEKRPQPTPLLVRAGWVRSKTSSVVSDSSSLIPSNHTKAQHLRSKSESAIPLVANVPRPSNVVPKKLGKSDPIDSNRRGTKSAKQQGTSKMIKSQETEVHQRPPSLLVVPGDFFQKEQAYHSDLQFPPPRPPKIPLNSRQDPNIKSRPPSMATFRSGSTKIGEIPERMWLNGRASTGLEDMGSLSCNLPPPLVNDEPKKKRRKLRFWNREE